MIGGKGDGDAVTAENSAGVTAVGHDDFLGRDDGNDGGGSDGVAVRSLKLASTSDSLAATVPTLHFVVHASETLLHSVLPFQILTRFVNFFLHDFVKPLLTHSRNLKLTTTKIINIVS